MPHTIIEFYIRRAPGNSLTADATLTSVASAIAAQLATNAPTSLNPESLRAATNDAAIYGRLLSAQLFTDRTLRDAWLNVRAHAADAPLQLRLRFDASAADLHAIRWETLRDPQNGQLITLHERVRLVRALDSADLTPVIIPPRPDLCALVVVASPSNQGAFRMAEVDVDGEVARARAALGDIPTTILGDHPAAAGRATLANLAVQLRDEPTIIILVAHGTLRDGQPVLWLERDDGRADQVAGADLLAVVERFSARPLLVVLLSCQRAVRGYSDTLSALGPGLARVGVSAVLGFQGDVAMSTVKALLPALIADLRRDGQIDRALAVARAALAAQRRPWWQPVLWLRTDGRLWQEQMPTALASARMRAGGSPEPGTAPGAPGASSSTNVWLWDRFGQEVPLWLAQQLNQHSELQDINLKPLKEASRKRWAQINWKQASQAYRDDIQQRCGSLLLFGTSEPVPLADVFTDLDLIDAPGAWQRHTHEELRRHPQDDHADADLRREGGALVARQRRLFILGPPGAGKTTFLKRLALQAVQGQIDAIPILISLKAWSDSSLDLMAFLTQQFAACRFPHAQPFIKTVLENGQVLLLFDGLDEIDDADGHNQRAAEVIREFAQQYGNNRIVITCRTAAREYTFEQFKYCQLADFSQAQIESFVGRWFQHDPLKGAAFLKRLALPGYARLRDLAGRPLQLSMLCLTFDPATPLPLRRVALYEEAIDALLKTWDSARGTARDGAYYALGLGYKRQLLCDLAGETIARGEGATPLGQLAEQAARFLRRLPPTDQREGGDGAAVLRAITAQHGLLIASEPDRYSFAHRSLQEYFAARYLVSRPNEQVLRGAVAQADRPQWREVLLYTASLLDYDNGALLFQLWGQQLQEQLLASPPLAQLLRWTARQVQRSWPSTPALRAAALTIALIDQALQINQELIVILERRDGEQDSDGDHDIDRTLTIARDRAHSLAFARASARTLAFARDTLDLDLDLDLDRAHTLARAHVHALARAHSHALDHLPAHARARATSAHTLSHALARAHALDEVLGSARASASIAARFKRPDSDDHYAALSHMPQQSWQLTEEHIATLGAYLASSQLLLDCLDLAAIEDRQTVLDHVLVSPRK